MHDEQSFWFHINPTSKTDFILLFILEYLLSKHLVNIYSNIRNVVLILRNDAKKTIFHYGSSGKYKQSVRRKSKCKDLEGCRNLLLIILQIVSESQDPFFCT